MLAWEKKEKKGKKEKDELKIIKIAASSKTINSYILVTFIH